MTSDEKQNADTTLPQTPVHDISLEDLDEPNLSFWFELIDEGAAANFLGVSTWTVHSWRSRGDSPVLLRLTSRCI